MSRHRASPRRRAARWVAAAAGALAPLVAGVAMIYHVEVSGAAPIAPAAPASQQVIQPAARPAPAPPGPVARRAVVPLAISIPAIGVHSRLARLDVDAAGVLRPPRDFARAGWYVRSRVPGELGPALIAGHVDSRSGPAVFFRLRELKPGNLVSVLRSDRRSVTFRVVAVDRYPKNRFPSATVYAATPDPELRLITCGGSFDRARRSYRDNVVVYLVAA